MSERRSTARHRALPRTPALAAVSLTASAVLLAAAGWVAADTGGTSPAGAAPAVVTTTPTPSAAPSTAPSASPSVAPTAPTAPTAAATEAAVAPPRRLRIPTLGVDTALEQLRTDRADRLPGPRDYQRAGWFAEGVAPGATGPAVVAGHLDSPTGRAVFSDLRDLRPGDVVEVDRTDGGTTRFRVDRLVSTDKADFPTAAVYGPTPDAQLRLITCDGRYVRDAGGYQGNLVVFATAL